MHPTRVARIAASLGVALLLLALALRLIAIGYTTSSLGLLEDPPATELPQVGGYQVSPDGAEIRFRQGDPESSVLPAVWYSMAAEGGSITPSEPLQPPDLAPFRLSEEVLYRQGASASSVVQVSPTRERVVEAALAPDGETLAFITRFNGERHRLYVTRATGEMVWLGEEAGYFHLAWSPDSTTLAFLAYRDGFAQLMVTGAGGEDYHALTSDPTGKSLPSWSPDGTQIAYMAVRPSPESRQDQVDGQMPSRPAPADVDDPEMEITLVDVVGGGPRRLAVTALNPAGVGWIVAGERPEVVYPVPHPDQPSTIYLYAVSPATGQSRRVYPPVMLEALQCPPTFPVEREAAAQLTITNSGLVPVDLPLVLREQHLPFTIADLFQFAAARVQELLSRSAPGPATGDPGEGSLRLETVTLLPGETRQVEWGSRAASGARITRLTASVDPAHPFPIPGQNCSAPNTYFGLPNLPFLAFTIALPLIGMLLCVPRLLQLKNGRWWAVWVAVPFLFFMLMLFEANIHYGG